MTPTLLSIHIAPVAGQPLVEVKEVRAAAGRGLEGDRYFLGTGKYTLTPGTGRHVTLIESEALEAARRDYAIEYAPGETRRNLVTLGVALNHLVGKEFSVGAVRLRGMRLCEPCTYWEELCGKQRAKQSLIHRGGLRCEILSDGVIKAGDAIVV